ncbi:MAG TPA: putative Ig domain-containing protein [Candidatus Udaeobacter sp.]|jgi:hypothetical protein|nr:putative Ig domain-containing protein [Candidatus Udaeobacter sp.]
MYTIAKKRGNPRDYTISESYFLNRDIHIKILDTFEVTGANKSMNIFVHHARGMLDCWLALAIICCIPTIANANPPVIAIKSDLDIIPMNEAFDPSGTPPWTRRALMPTPRQDFAIASAAGLIYVAGGKAFDNCQPVDKLESYNPQQNSWSAKSPMLNPRWLAGAGMINGIMYVVGGQTGCGGAVATVDSYATGTDTWSSAPRDLPQRRARYAMGVGVVDNVLYAIGGNNTSDTATDFVDAYDPGTDTWAPKTSMPTKRGYPVVVVAHNKIYAIGGLNNGLQLNAVEEFDPAGNQGMGSWRSKQSIPILQTKGAGGVINNLIYVIAGIDSTATTIPADLLTVQTFDPVANSWTTGPDALTARSNHGAAVVNNILYAVGGTFPGVARVGQPFTYQLVATNHPTSYTASGLPAGLNFDTTLGLIYGIPTDPSDTTLQFTATNNDGTGLASTRLVVQPHPAAAIFVNGTTATARTNQSFSFPVLIDNASATAQARIGGLPPGLTFDPVAGIIMGTPTKPGNFPVVLSLKDEGSGTQERLQGTAVTTQEFVQLNITADAAIPVITSAESVNLVPFQDFTYHIVSDIAATGYKYIGFDGNEGGTLPFDLSLDQLTGIISGTYMPDTIRIRPPLVNQQGITLIASNSNGMGTSPLYFWEPQAVSRLTHGSFGDFDIDLPVAVNSPGIECRSGGTNEEYHVIFTFRTSVSVGGARVITGTATIGDVTSVGQEITVNLSGVSDVQTLTLTLTDVNDGISLSDVDVDVSLGVLIGDAIPDGKVKKSDGQQVIDQRHQPLTSSNFWDDIDASGSIDSTDVSLVRSHAGNQLPP